MDLTFVLLVIAILLVLIFNFTNGFHDAADMVATAIASHSMKGSVAIALVSISTFIAPLVVGFAVADTIGNFINLKNIALLDSQSIIIGALLAAITYNIITWKLGFPSSSSTSLAGGLVGSGLLIAGVTNINFGLDALQHGHFSGLLKVLLGLFASPILGFVIGYFVMKIFLKVFSVFTIRIRPWFVGAQYISVAFLGFSHGANDAQKGMAIIGMMLFASGYTTSFEIPFWVVLSCSLALTIGTMFGGWNIIKTLGFEIYKIRIIHSVANQLSSSFVNAFATLIGAPTSTTQVVTAALFGNGAAEKPAHVNWKKASWIGLGWLLNIPISIMLGALYSYLFLHLIKG